MAFFGTYREVTPSSRPICTNEEGEDAETVNPVTFDEENEKTLLVVHDHYSSIRALDAAIAYGAPERLDQFDAFIVCFVTSQENV